MVFNGKVISAVEEERFRRIKHWAGFPSESIQYCLDQAGISLSDVDYLAINQNSRISLLKKIAYTLLNKPDIKLLIKKFKTKRDRDDVEEHLRKSFPGQVFRGKVYPVEHHLAHLSSAFHVSPFNDAVAVSVDGFGDFASTAWGVGHGVMLEVEKRIYFPHSLGIFYQALTQFIGFPNYGDEYKVMGLAPYGNPTYLPQMREILLLQTDGGFKLNLKYFRHHLENVEYDGGDNKKGSPPRFKNLYSPELEKLLGSARTKDQELDQRYMDIASSIQAMYEEAFFHLLN